MNCVRISHPDVKELAKQMNLPRSVVASKIAVWQDTNNNLDRFPTLEELQQGMPKADTVKETPLAKTIRTQLSAMFPQVKVFNDKQQFLDYINAVHNAGITFFDAIGAAYANSIYIDPNKAQQDTYFHEIAHLYWKALPNDNPVKQQLIKAYVTEERAVTAIGKAGVDIAALKVPGMSMTKINALWKQFWSATKSLFGIKTDSDYARIMANDIWNNKEMFEAFTNNEIEFQKLFGFIPIRDVTKKQKDVELMEDDYSRIIDMRSDIPINQWTRANVTQIRMFNERATNLVADPDVIVRQIQAKLNGFKEDIPAGKILQDLTPFEYMSIVNQHPMVDIDGPTSIDTQIDPKSLTWITSGNKKTYKGLSKAKWIERVKQSGEHPNILSIDADVVDKLYNRYLLDMEKIQDMFEGYTNYLDFIYAPSQGYAGKKGLSDMIFMLKTLESKEAANFALNDVSQLIYDEILVKNIATEALPGYSAYKEYTILMGKMLMGERTKQFNTWLSQEAISQMNVKNIHAQVIFDAIAKETQKINITTAALLKKLKEYQKAIKKEGRSTAECKVLATSGKYQIETWVSDPAQLASLSRNQRRYIEVAKEILRTIGYDSEIIPQARMGFWDSFFSTSAWSTKPFWKRVTIIPALINFEFARMNGLTARTSYDNIYVTYNGVTQKVVTHRESLIKDVRNKKISIGKAKSEMKKVIEKAEELRKNGVDDALEVIYNNDTYEISTNFGKVFDAYSVSNFDAVINNFVKAQTFKYYMEPMLPTVDIFKKNFIESEAKKKFAEQWFDKTMSTLLNKSTKDQSAKKWVESGINFYTGWTAFRFLGFNWQAATMNLTAGYSNNITHFGIGIVMRGHERLVKNPKKCYAILDKLNIVSTTVDESFNLSQHYQTIMNQLTFFTSTAPEYINQGTVFIGMMTDEQFDAYDSNGNIKEYVIDPTTGQKKIAPKGVKGTLDNNALDANQINLMQMQIARVHGAYHKLFKRPVAQNVLLRPVVMFKTWMFEMYNILFGDLDFVRGGIRQKSIIKDTGKTLFNRMFADIRGLADKPEWTEADRQNVKKFVTLSFLIVGAAIASGMTDDDDKKGLLGRIFKSIYSLGVEYRKEAVTVVSPILVTLWDSMELFVYGVTQEKYERGKHKGEPKWQYRAKTLTPFRALWKDDPNESIKNEDEMDDYQLFLKEQKEAMKEAGLPEIEEEPQAQ
jgi:hypothetical protein